MNSEPIRWARSVARSRTSAIEAVPACGSSYSIGTSTLAHWNGPCFRWHGDQAIFGTTRGAPAAGPTPPVTTSGSTSVAAAIDRNHVRVRM
jgi:hypothetical protein